MRILGLGAVPLQALALLGGKVRVLLDLPSMRRDGSTNRDRLGLVEAIDDGVDAALNQHPFDLPGWVEECIPTNQFAPVRW